MRKTVLTAERKKRRLRFQALTGAMTNFPFGKCDKTIKTGLGNDYRRGQAGS